MAVPSDLALMIQRARFTPVRIHEGYSMSEVDDLLDRLVVAVLGEGDVRALVAGVRFDRVRLREGYDIAEVDAFLEQVVDVAEGRADVPPLPEPDRPGLLSRLLGRS